MQPTNAPGLRINQVNGGIPLQAGISKADQSNQIPYPFPTYHIASPYRVVFQTDERMKTEFVKFLKTIFYQLDDKKVLALMEEILNADSGKTDDQIYTELLSKIDTAKKRFPFLSQLWSLSVLKKGMGNQVMQLMKSFNGNKFNDYMEIYDRRYVKTIRKMAKLPLKGEVIAVSDGKDVAFGDRLQASALFSRYPYKKHVPLNDKGCMEPLLHPEQTARPIGDEVSDNSVDFIACLGGLHHMPEDRVDNFVSSMHAKLRPGAVIILRDHNADENVGPANLSCDQVKAIASVVHSFVNAAAGVSLAVENQELRHFNSVKDWSDLMQKHGFTRISADSLVLKNDPTENAMFAFVKTPRNLDELEQAMSYRNDCLRTKEGTRATWIEWGNVRYSKQYANHIQKHHSYSFDYVGHMRQHWSHFYHFVKESLKDREVSLAHSLFNDGMLMNLFILIGTSLECSLGALTSVPSRTIARCKHGKNWRCFNRLTDLEKLDAKFAKQYAKDLDTIPFYLQTHIGKIKQVSSTLWNSKESWMTKLSSIPSAISKSIGFLAMGIVSAPLAAIYTQDAFKEPETVKMLIEDPSNEINQVIELWETYKDKKIEDQNKIEVMHTTQDGHKLISVPRYRAFTKIFGYLENTNELKVLKIGGQTEISVDLLLNKDFNLEEIKNARKIYELKNLQDPQKRRYLTYQVNVTALKQFQSDIGPENMHYIHE